MELARRPARAATPRKTPVARSLQRATELREVAIPSDGETGRPRGFAFVTMGSDGDAKAAIAAMDGKELDGRSLRVNEAQDKPRSGGGGRSGRLRWWRRRTRALVGDKRRPSEPPYPDSLCHRCVARQYVRGRATLFVMCTALPVKYPPQPVLRCEVFKPKLS